MPTPRRAPLLVPDDEDERRLCLLQRQISLANTYKLAERNALLHRLRFDYGYAYKDLAGLLSAAAMAVGDSALTPSAVEKAIKRHPESALQRFLVDDDVEAAVG